jgi:ribosomal protein S18 acetylase RimI-like enzyme
MIPPPEPGVRYERAGPVIRAVGTWNAVLVADLTPETANAAIAAQLAFFRSTPRGPTAPGAADGGPYDPSIEWKVYGHDVPSDLGSRLAAAGFVAGEGEALMVFDLRKEWRADRRAAAPPLPVEIRRVTNVAGVTDAVSTARAAFGRAARWQTARTAEYLLRLGDSSFALYVAYVEGRPVASARAEFPVGRSFAGLWGGGTSSEYRGHGIYRALVRARAEEARRRGYRYLRVDARETSRPILERLGFIPLASIVEWTFLLTPRCDQEPRVSKPL